MSQQRGRQLTELERYKQKGYLIQVDPYTGILPSTHSIEDTPLPAGFNETALAGHPQFKEIGTDRLARLERSQRGLLERKAAKGDQWSAQAKADLGKLRKAQEIRAWGAIVTGERIADDPGDPSSTRPKRLHPEETTTDLVIYQIGKGPFRVHVGMSGAKPGTINDQTLNGILLGSPMTVINPQTLAQLITEKKPVQVHTQVTQEMDQVHQIKEKP